MLLLNNLLNGSVENRLQRDQGQERELKRDLLGTALWCRLSWNRVFLDAYPLRTWDGTYQSVNISLPEGEIPLGDEMIPFSLSGGCVILFGCLQR